MLHSGERAASIIRWSSLPLEKPEDLLIYSPYTDSLTFGTEVVTRAAIRYHHFDTKFVARSVGDEGGFNVNANSIAIAIAIVILMCNLTERLESFQRRANRLLREIGTIEVVAVTLLSNNRVSSIGPLLGDAASFGRWLDVELPPSDIEDLELDVEGELARWVVVRHGRNREPRILVARVRTL